MSYGHTHVDLVVTDRGIGRLVEGTTLLELIDTPEGDLAEVLANDGSFRPLLERRVVEVVDQTNTALKSPLGAALQWGIGLNYRCKAVVSGRSTPPFPTLFCKPATATAAPGDELSLATAFVDNTGALVPTRYDYEGEVAVVIGRPTWCVDAQDMWSHIAGYTAANDITSRALMAYTTSPTMAKGAAGIAPIGPSIRVADGPPHEAISLRTEVNGVERQRANTDALIIDIADLVALLSHHVLLSPGDVVLTGCPSGSGDETQTYLSHGDEVTVYVDDMLPLRNRISTYTREDA